MLHFTPEFEKFRSDSLLKFPPGNFQAGIDFSSSLRDPRIDEAGHRSGPKWAEVVRSGPKWSEVVRSGPKWDEVNRTRAGPEVCRSGDSSAHFWPLLKVLGMLMSIISPGTAPPSPSCSPVFVLPHAFATHPAYAHACSTANLAQPRRPCAAWDGAGDGRTGSRVPARALCG